MHGRGDASPGVSLEAGAGQEVQADDGFRNKTLRDKGVLHGGCVSLNQVGLGVLTSSPEVGFSQNLAHLIGPVAPLLLRVGVTAHKAGGEFGQRLSADTRENPEFMLA